MLDAVKSKMNTEDFPDLKTGLSVADAFGQLENSGRGRAAMVSLRKFLEANDRSALSLDPNNWRALETILQACRRGYAFKICEALPKR